MVLIFAHTHLLVNVYKDQHFLRPEEARFEPGKSLSCYQLFILFLRKLSVQKDKIVTYKEEENSLHIQGTVNKRQQ